MDNVADDFYRELPKVELHAHLNGSVSFQTMEKVMKRKPHLNIEHHMTAIGKGQRRSLDECFQVFKVIHQLVDTQEDILMVATDVIKEFAADGVKYLELRSTPREETKTGLNKKNYVETVIGAIQQCKEEGVDIEVRFLVAIDRRNGSEVAMETVKLAEDFMLSADGLVVGLDLSGDPTVCGPRQRPAACLAESQERWTQVVAAPLRSGVPARGVRVAPWSPSGQDRSRHLSTSRRWRISEPGGQSDQEQHPSRALLDFQHQRPNCAVLLPAPLQVLVPVGAPQCHLYGRQGSLQYRLVPGVSAGGGHLRSGPAGGVGALPAGHRLHLCTGRTQAAAETKVD
ncbi:adenosine deaminase-like protein isoform X2 [Nerophis ophidion]|uniref:adenosine deaminase-like protein isoform X2 n=1 Tax=Nerophis ophidion TaxID=159077 RepID=UPI002AE0A45D|nr:adenosine deaminase-like protein isoform X2 [Nerophis ophidion]